MEQITTLAKGIGPRGSTTQNEAATKDFIVKELKNLVYDPKTEEFISAKSGWYPYALFAFLMLFAELLYMINIPAAAVVISIISLVSVITELLFKANLFRLLLPKGKSANVTLKIEPKGEVKKKVILMAHMDSHRTPIAFSSPGWVKLFDVLVPIGLASAFIMTVIYSLSIFIFWQYWTILTIPFTAVLAAIFIITIQTDFTPYTEGANDNASGVAVCLGIAEKLKNEALAGVETWIVFSGCEEVGCYGADNFAALHNNELKDAYWITVDSVGSPNAKLCYLTREKFLLEAKSDPFLVSIADSVSKENPDIGAKSCDNFIGAYTESSIADKYGYKVLTLIALSEDGRFENWHQTSDVLDNVDPDMVEKCFRFAWEILKEIDKK